MSRGGFGGGVGIAALAVAGLGGLIWGWSAAAAPGVPSGLAIALGAGALGGAIGLAAARRGRARLAPEASGGEQAATLAALRREAADARVELDAIHSSVSHDLRSPIGAVLNFLTVFEEDHGAGLDADGRAVLTRIRRSALSALTLLDGLSRVASAGRRPMAAQVVDVEELVRDAFAAARPADRAVELTVLVPLPPAFGDPELLRTAFAELLANAIKFSAGCEKASVTVGGRDDDGALAYWVADEGVGFDPRFAGKLFHVFERLHGRDEFPGAGVGLAVVRRIAERHGGRVAAEGAPERGATFRLFLPAGPDGETARGGAS